MTSITLRMTGLARTLRIRQSESNPLEYLCNMPGYQTYIIKCDSIAEVLPTAIAYVGNMRRDEAALARAQARGRKLQESLKARRQGGGVSGHGDKGKK